MTEPTTQQERDKELSIYQRLAEKMRYDYETGVLYWEKNKFHPRLNGTPAGRADALGYLRIHTNGTRMVSVHRLIFFMHHGWLPDLVDHKDGNNGNNLIDNLRPATSVQNAQNCKTPINNTSGMKGVYWHSSTGKWSAAIRVEKRLKHLGLFAEREHAEAARKSAEAVYYGEYAR